MNNYIVYGAYIDKNIMYVGSGKPERWKHIISGTSHCYLANKAHFDGRNVEVKILRKGLTKEDSLKEECRLIQELKPDWNRENCYKYPYNKLEKVYDQIFKEMGLSKFKEGRRYNFSKKKEYIQKFVKDVVKNLDHNNEWNTTVYYLRSSNIELYRIIMKLINNNEHYKELRSKFRITKVDENITIFLM